MKQRLSVRWTSHIKDPEEKKNFEQFVYASRDVLERLAALIKKMEVEDRPESIDDYNQPNWPYRQADHVGFKRAVKKILDLVEI